MDTLLRSCGFILDKWRSNREHVVPSKESSSTEDVLELSEFNDTTVLGLRWFPKMDELTFKFQPSVPLQRHEATKRKVLSCIAKIFDPNGYIGPIVIVAKILMQKIWNANINWDTLVPDEIFRAWQQFQQQLPLITDIRLPRWLGINSQRNVSLHGFADASLMAYGAVLYARVDSNDHIECILIAAKSRVAPLKPITVPRLELCAAQLLSELVRAFKVSSKMAHVKTTLWSDSQIVLAWLAKDAAALKIFVNNRVQRIGRLTSDADWRYVPSADNPADLLSRGLTAAALQNASLWWHGPEWLVRSPVYWPITQPILSAETAQAITDEAKTDNRNNGKKIRQIHKALAVMSVSIQNIDLLERASSGYALFRKTAWIFRFINNLRHRGARSNHRQYGILSNAEVEVAQEYWIREEQRIYYAKEIEALKDPKRAGIETGSSIHRFNPWLDKKEVLRIHGRLERALIPEHQKYPVLLPDVSLLAKLLIREAHERTLHGGLHDMMAYLRQKFWITNLRRAIRLSNFQCIRCTRERQQNMQQMMGTLPSDRVQPSRAFLHSGVDYAGPFLLKARAGRCNIMEKKWVAVFVCMVTKAVHLELVDGLSAENFVQAFLNFTGIRGACTRLWSDNGKNFVKGEKELQKMLRTWKTMDMSQVLQKYGTEWRFITPSAPLQGGLWEAAVKSMKYHLRRIIGPHKLTSSDFRSILIQTSAVMNSRPLSAQSDDPEDLSFLTPAHFLIGEPIVQPFGANVQDVPDNRLKMAAQRQKMTQIFWKEWSQDYLNELQQRPKWRKVQPNLKPGDLVIIREENTPPTLWKSARVLEVYPGSDGLVRKVSLKVATSDWNEGEKRTIAPLRRPIQKLCRLPLEVEAESSRAQNVECG